MTIRILVADDEPLVRAGIVMLLELEPDFAVIAEVGTGMAAVAAARSLIPDIVLLDIRMPDGDGVEATRLIAQQTSETSADHLVKILVLTTFDDDDAVYGALRAGASGFLLKYAAPQDLPAAVRRVAGGDAWIDQAVAAKVIRAVVGSPQPGDHTALIDRLTGREREVLTLVAAGLSNREIVEQLVISEATVKTHVSRILMKTGSRDRAQAVALAYLSGLVVVPPQRA